MVSAYQNTVASVSFSSTVYMPLQLNTVVSYPVRIKKLHIMFGSASICNCPMDAQIPSGSKCWRLPHKHQTSLNTKKKISLQAEMATLPIAMSYQSPGTAQQL